MNHAGLLFVLISALNGILLTLILLGFRSPEWLKKNGILLILLPAPLGCIVLSLSMEILGLCGVLSVARLLIVAVVTAVILLIPSIKAASAIPWKSVCYRTVSSREMLFVPIAILFITSVVFPFEFIVGTHDCGPYLAAGVQAFQTGSFQFTDSTLAEAEPGFKALFYRVRKQPEFQRYGELTTGFPILDREGGRVGPRYFMLHSLWLGLFFTLLGLKPALMFATPFLGFMAFIAIYLTARAVAGVTPALLTSFLMSIHLIPVWFSRYITTEMAVTAPLFLGLALLIYFDDSPRGWIPAWILAGCAVGLTHFARIDSVLLIPVTFMFIALSLCFGKHPRRIIPFAMSYLTVLAAALYSAVTVTLPYTLETFRHLETDPTVFLGFAIGMFLLLSGLTAVVFRHKIPIQKFVVDRRNIILTIVIAVLVLLSLYGYIVRPLLNPVDQAAYTAANSEVRSKSLTQMTLRWMAWYLTLPGLVLACAGFFILLARKWSVTTSLFFLTSLMYGLFFFHSQRCTPTHLWVMRRFSTVIIPVLMMGLGVCFYFFWRAVSGRRYKTAGKVAISLGFAILALIYLTDMNLIRRFPLWQGAVAATEEIHGALPDHAVLVLEKTPGAYFYTPLRFLYGDDVYIRHRADLTGHWKKAVEQWQKTGRAVYLMASAPVKEETEGFVLDRVLSRRRFFPLLSQSPFEKPHKAWQFQMDYYLYRLGESVDGSMDAGI